VEEAIRRARQAELTRLRLVWLLSADAAVSWIGTAESPDGKADVLEITPANQPAIRLFLDQSSRLPLMITWQRAAQQLFLGRRGRGGDPSTRLGGGGPGGSDAARGTISAQGAGAEQATLRMTLGEYQVVAGILFPRLITRGTSEQTIEEWTVDSYRVNPSFRSDVFTK
jgi:hypothetical protein